MPTGRKAKDKQVRGRKPFPRQELGKIVLRGGKGRSYVNSKHFDRQTADLLDPAR